MYSCYTSLSLKEYTGGKTVKGKVRISKIGGRQLRQTLMYNYPKTDKRFLFTKAWFEKQ